MHPMSFLSSLCVSAPIVLVATPLKLEKQIQFEIRRFTDSMHELLAPHAAIATTCHVAYVPSIS